VDYKYIVITYNIIFLPINANKIKNLHQFAVRIDWLFPSCKKTNQRIIKAVPCWYSYVCIYVQRCFHCSWQHRNPYP